MREGRLILSGSAPHVNQMTRCATAGRRAVTSSEASQHAPERRKRKCGMRFSFHRTERKQRAARARDGVLRRGDKITFRIFENPQSGARGNLVKGCWCVRDAADDDGEAIGVCATSRSIKKFQGAVSEDQRGRRNGKRAGARRRFRRHRSLVLKRVRSAGGSSRGL